MKWLFIILLLLFLLLIVVIFTKLKVFLDYYHGNDNDHLIIEFKAWAGLIKYKLNVPVIKIDDDSPSVVTNSKVETGPKENDKKNDTSQFSKDEILSSFSDTKELIQHVVGLHKLVRQFLNKVILKDVEWHTIVGVGNAAHTGVLTGALWGVKGGIIGLLSNYMKLREMPHMSITPCFQFPVSQTRFKCMIQFRIGHAMLAGIKLIKFWKGGRPSFKTKPLSILSDSKTKSI